MTPFLLVLSSPSGGGKTTIARALLDARDDLGYSVSVTTRAPREGETDGRDYHFVTRAEFERRRRNGAFLESAEYGGAWYGTLEADVNTVLEGGRHVVLDIEVQGARIVRQRRDDVVSIFILPPSAQTLADRLAARSSEAPTAVRQRLLRAAQEVAAAGEYDYLVVNDDRTRAVADVAAIIDAESHRATRWPDLRDTLTTLRRELGVVADSFATGEE